MKTFILAVFLILVAASAEAGLSKGPPQIETVRNAHAETPAAVKPAAEPAVKKKRKRRREDDEDILGKDDKDIDIDL